MEDEREEEVSSIAAIYPELVVDDTAPFEATLDLQVTPTTPFAVRFPALHSTSIAFDCHVPALQDEHKLQHLPALHLKISLPEGYPADKAPSLHLSSSHSWLPCDKLQELEAEGAKLWEEYGRCQILFSYIDFLQQSSERLFDLLSPLTLSPDLKPSLLEFDSRTRKQVFDAATFDCGVCLEPKKGSSCHKLHSCGHVFCLSCLQDFYNNCITEGDVVNVKCMDPGCGKSKDPQENQRKRKRKAEKTLHPKELLTMGIPESAVRRFVEMKRKKKLEADKTTIYCPRTWCQAPARSARYPPIPADLSHYLDSDSDCSDHEHGPPPAYTKDTPENRLPAIRDRLAVCSKCQLAFCSVCYTGWHGEFARCWPRNPADLSEEEKASYDYIRLHTSPCPTCSSPTQKTMGCNHMKCFQCNSHFCYLCGAWLLPDNPYQHFNNKSLGCYMRLWELEEGDEGAGQVAFEGARRWEAEARAVAEEADREEAERLQAGENELAQAEEAEHEAWEEDVRQARAPRNGGGPGGRGGRGGRGARRPDGPAHPPDQVPPDVLAAFERIQLGGQPVQAVQAGPPRRARAPAQGRQAGQGAGGRAPQVQAQAQAQPQVDPRAAAAFRRFLEMAERDEEDDWDSDELDDAGDDMWEIPFQVR